MRASYPVRPDCLSAALLANTQRSKPRLSVIVACSDSIHCLNLAILTNYPRVQVQGQLLCYQKPVCWRCKQAPEAVAIHPDCLALFQSHCRRENALDRLWARIEARRIWRGAPSLRLDSATNLDIGLVCAKAEGCGIPGLRRLPPELIYMVYELSEKATFWRYVAIVSLGRELEAAPPASRTLPLRSVSAWTRGAEPSQSSQQSPDHPPILRLTIDRRGLAQIERLSERPPYRRGRSDSMAYVVLTEGEDDLENIIMHYKVIDTTYPLC